MTTYQLHYGTAGYFIIEQSPASYRILNFRMAYTLDLRSLTFKYMYSFFRPLEL